MDREFLYLWVRVNWPHEMGFKLPRANNGGLDIFLQVFSLPGITLLNLFRALMNARLGWFD